MTSFARMLAPAQDAGAEHVGASPVTVEAIAAGIFELCLDHALRDRAALASGETLLVLGAAGGVGLAAVEIGKALGSLPPRKAAEMLISAARVRAKGKGDNVSLAIVKLTGS